MLTLSAVVRSISYPRDIPSPRLKYVSCALQLLDGLVNRILVDSLLPCHVDDVVQGDALAHLFLQVSDDLLDLHDVASIGCRDAGADAVDVDLSGLRVNADL